MRNAVLISLLFIILENTYCLDTNTVKYYPLKIGNIWINHYATTNIYNTNHYYRDEIDSSIIVNGHRYFRFLHTCKYVSGYPPCSPPSYFYLRIDSVNGVLYQLVTTSGCSYYPNNLILDSLQARLNDTVKPCLEAPPVHKAVCIDTSDHTIFGILRPAKYLVVTEFEYGEERRYFKDFGPVYRMTTGISGSTLRTLVGCVINGVVYGDTTFMTGLPKISSEIPDNFSLHQNYPNPFNPVTRIKFEIPLSRGVSEGRGVSVTLVIYDILGREVATLVNEQLKPGTYEIEWDGTNYPSGVYFYKLITADFAETKKTILIK